MAPMQGIVITGAGPIIDVAVLVFGSVMASSGLWTYIDHKRSKNCNENKLLLGLARNEIIREGMIYIKRGSIRRDEYDDFVKYIYTPYASFGGNGLADKIYHEVSALPIESKPTTSERLRS